MQLEAPVLTPKKSDTLTQEEYAAFKRMREAGALVPINDALLPRGGWLVNGCEDGDRAPEAIHHLRSRACELSGKLQCTHLPLIVGGPAAAVPTCPFYELTYKGRVVAWGDELLFARIEKALVAKPGKIPNFANQPHFVCGMCRLHKVSIWENFRLSLICKDIVRNEFGKAFGAYAVLPHLDLTGYPEELTGPGPYRTYYLHRPTFESLYEQVTSSASTPILQSAQ